MSRKKHRRKINVDLFWLWVSMCRTRNMIQEVENGKLVLIKIKNYKL